MDYKIVILLIALSAVLVSGCTGQNSNSTGYKTFELEGISFQYPGNWTLISTPANDGNLTSQSGYKVLGVIVQGTGLQDYNAILEIGKTSIRGGNLTEAADRLYKYYISAESGDYLNKTAITLKNGYTGYLYTYGGTGASSGKSVDVQTYIITKDNQTAYYLQFGTPKGLFEQKKATFQAIVDSIKI